MLHALEAGIHRSSVHRDRLRAGALLRQRGLAAGPVRVLGADETGVRIRGQAQLVGFVVDGESGKTIGVDMLVRQDGPAFRRWLERYTKTLGSRAVRRRRRWCANSSASCPPTAATACCA